MNRRFAIKAIIPTLMAGGCLGIIYVVEPKNWHVPRWDVPSQLPTIDQIQAAYESSLTTPNAAAVPWLVIVDSRCTEGRRGSFLCEVKYQSQNDLKKIIGQTDLVAVERNDDGTWNLLSGMCRPIE